MNQSNAQQAPGGTKLVVVALALALVSVIVVNVYVEHVKSQVRADSFIAYRLNRSVRPGETFRTDWVDAEPMPKSFESSFQGFVRGELDLRARVGDVVHRSAEQGEFLMNQVFTPPTGGGEYRRPRVGMRFVKLEINPRNVPGNLQPEMVVDILAPLASAGALPSVVPVMERVRVIAVGTRTANYEADTGRSRPIGNFHNITIEVTPEEAVYLSLIEKMTVGDFELHLRNPADEQHPNIPSGGINPQLIDMIEKMRTTASRGVPGGRPGPQIEAGDGEGFFNPNE